MSTTTISAQDINKLRQMTGAGMMDCRKALTETNGDFEAAIEWLRKQGQKVAAKRSDREAKEGVVIAQTPNPPPGNAFSIDTLKKTKKHEVHCSKILRLVLLSIHLIM
jgi:phage terminase Nu1 subunit (DNA packaging protein)